MFTLIDGGKLANQIATLLSIVVKILLALSGPKASRATTIMIICRFSQA